VLALLFGPFVAGRFAPGYSFLDSRFGCSVLGSSFLALWLLLAVRFVPGVLFLGVAITESARRYCRYWE